MKHLLGIIVFLSLAYAQENYISVNFQLHSNQVLADSDIVYIAGSFNNWHPGDKLYAMHKAGDKYELELRLPRNSMFEYKFTLGSWEKVEINENFEDTPNRILKTIDNSVRIDSVWFWDSPIPLKDKYSRRFFRDIDKVIGKELPKLQVKLLDQNFKPANSSELKYLISEKPTFLLFWSTTCPPCKIMMRTLDSLDIKYKENLHVIMLSRDIMSPKDVEKLSKINAPNVTHAMIERTKDINYIYNFPVNPLTMILSNDGKLVEYFIGVKRFDELIELVE
jgi:thiol-disulfide isomerase/thioredoxin